MRGADAIVEAGLRPNLVVGDLESVSDAALRSGAEVVVHSGHAGRPPGMDRLERLGYIERRRTDADRRVIRIAMTELAQSSGQEMFAPLARKLHQVIQGYPSEQVELITQFLREATAGVDEVREATASQIPTRKRA